MATTTHTIYVNRNGRRVPMTVTERTGADVQLIAGCKVLASASPARREQVLGGGFRFQTFSGTSYTDTKFT